MIREIITDLTLPVKEKLRNPILRSYLVFWFALNWKTPVILLLSGSSIEERLQLIGREAYPWETAFGVPAALAVAYVLAMPWVSYGVQKYQTVPNKRRRTAEIEFQTELTRGRTQLAQGQLRLQTIRNQLLVEQQVKESQIHEVENDNRQLKTDVQRLERDLTDEKRHTSQLQIENEALKRQIQQAGYKTKDT